MNFYHFWNIDKTDPTGKTIPWADSYNKIMDLIFGQFLLIASIIAAIITTTALIFALVKLIKAKSPEDRKTQGTRMIIAIVGLIIILFVEVGIPLIIKFAQQTKKQLKDENQDLFGYNAPNYQLPYLSDSQIQTKTHTYTLAS